MTGAIDVLVVEDEMLLAMDLEAMIEDSGHRVLGGAASLDEVAALPSDLNPQLVLLDLHLARGSSGLDVSDLVQRRWPDALIVFVTANAAKIPADFAGAHGLIAKPFSNTGIVGALRYLAQGLVGAVPAAAPPASLTMAPTLARRWQR